MAGLEVTIIIPTYNDAHMLRAGLESLYGQTVKPSAVIIVDDGSSDLVAIEALSILKQDFPDAVFLRQDNAGPSIARNRGLDRVETEYTAFLDADDQLRPDALEHRFGLMQADPEVIASYAGYVGILEGVEIKQSAFRKHLPSKLNPDKIGHPQFYPGGTPLWLFKTAPLKEIGGFDKSLSIMEDFDLILRLQHLRGKFSGDNEPIYIRNLRENSHSRGSRIKRFKGINKFLRKARREGYFSKKELLRRYTLLVGSTLKP